MTLRYGIVGYPARFSDLAAQVSAAEHAGFDGWFFSEHHGQAAGYHFGGNLEAIAAVAALTSRISLGTCVLVLPLHHPIALAESTAVLDHISGGRLILGLGMGYQRQDFDALSVDRRYRSSLFEEGLAVLRQAWTEGRVAFHGRRFDFDDVVVHPRPSSPPPVWIGAWTDAGVRRAARLGDAWIADPLHSIGALQLLRRAYLEEAALHRRPVRVALTRFVALGSSRSDALRRHGAALELVFRSYFRARAFTRTLDPWMASVGSPSDITGERLVADRVALGPPDECARTLRTWSHALGADWVVVTFITDLPRSHEETVEAIAALGACLQEPRRNGGSDEQG